MSPTQFLLKQGPLLLKHTYCLQGQRICSSARQRVSVKQSLSEGLAPHVPTSNPASCTSRLSEDDLWPPCTRLPLAFCILSTALSPDSPGCPGIFIYSREGGLPLCPRCSEPTSMTTAAMSYGSYFFRCLSHLVRFPKAGDHVLLIRGVPGLKIEPDI